MLGASFRCSAVNSEDLSRGLVWSWMPGMVRVDGGSLEGLARFCAKDDRLVGADPTQDRARGGVLAHRHSRQSELG